MKQVYIINENHPQLLLFFAGWAADETPFKQYRPKNMDYMICYDYRTLDFDYSIFDRYRQVNVVACGRSADRERKSRSLGLSGDIEKYCCESGI